jgi:hypothetical protein
MDMLPKQIAEQMGPREYVKLCSKVEKEYHQKFGVISIEHSTTGTIVTIETQDDVRHVITL